MICNYIMFISCLCAKEIPKKKKKRISNGRPSAGIQSGGFDAHDP